MDNDRVLVQGTAGSGKTLLALEFALTLADRGERALFLCFNRHLAAWLQEQAKHDPRAQRVGARLEIATFHAYARSLAKRASVPFDVPESGEQSFWDDEVPLIRSRRSRSFGRVDSRRSSTPSSSTRPKTLRPTGGSPSSPSRARDTMVVSMRSSI